jgi:hypothetical protein
MPAPVRSDALPEFHDYVDEGCVFHPTCLTCPAAQCRYDARKGIQTLLNFGRDIQVRVDRALLGLSATALAQRHHVSERTVHRILAASRRAA